MSADGKQKRREQRKYQRIFVRYGAKAPEHHAIAMHLSSKGLFLSTNEFVFANGSTIVVEITGKAATWVVRGLVRHAVKVHPNMARFTKPGMGVELADMPPGLQEYLASL